MEETDKIKTSTITATWTCARPLTQSPTTSLSPNWSDMDLRGGLSWIRSLLEGHRQKVVMNGSIPGGGQQ